jgi:ABC-type sugar transport system ATPase subunit
VLDLIRNLRDSGTAIALVSHNMADVVAVASRVAVLKNGLKIYDQPLRGLTVGELGHMIMTGQSAPQLRNG